MAKVKVLRVLHRLFTLTILVSFPFGISISFAAAISQLLGTSYSFVEVYLCCLAIVLLVMVSLTIILIMKNRAVSLNESGSKA